MCVLGKVLGMGMGNELVYFSVREEEEGNLNEKVEDS